MNSNICKSYYETQGQWGTYFVNIFVIYFCNFVNLIMHCFKKCLKSQTKILPVVFEKQCGILMTKKGKSHCNAWNAHAGDSYLNISCSDQAKEKIRCPFPYKICCLVWLNKDYSLTVFNLKCTVKSARRFDFSLKCLCHKLDITYMCNKLCIVKYPM